MQDLELMPKLFSKVVGVTFENRQNIIRGLSEGEVLLLEREPDNKIDANAIKVLRNDEKQLGYISAELANEMASAMDSGIKYFCVVKNLTGIAKETKGVNIEIKKIS